MHASRSLTHSLIASLYIRAVVNVKWNKSSYDVDVEPSEGLETFQAALFSLTNVPAERQKLMCKGKLLRSDADIAALPADSRVMLMGTADAIAAGPAKQVLFEEDLTEKDRVQLSPSTVTSAGLVNLGNTWSVEQSTDNRHGGTDRMRLRERLTNLHLPRVSL